MVTVITYKADPADHPAQADVCEAGGLHEWKSLNPFTINKYEERALGIATHKCEKCRQFAKIPQRRPEGG